MIKLFRLNNEELEYAEIWHNNTTACIHIGTVGQRGELTEKKRNYERNEKMFLEKYLKQGYTEGDFKQLVLSFKLLKVVTTIKECEFLKEKTIHILNEEFGWRGLGHVDGWDFSESKIYYELNVFCFSVDKSKAEKYINTSLKLNGITSKFSVK